MDRTTGQPLSGIDYFPGRSLISCQTRIWYTCDVARLSSRVAELIYTAFFLTNTVGLYNYYFPNMLYFYSKTTHIREKSAILVMFLIIDFFEAIREQN